MFILHLLSEGHFYKRKFVLCADDLVSDSGVTEVLEKSTPTPSCSYLPPDPDITSRRGESVLDNRSEYRDANTSVSPVTDRATSHSSHVTAASSSFRSAVTERTTAPGSGDVQTLPKLELKEPTLVVSIIQVYLPWLFWVQRHSKNQELEDILDRLE